MKIAKIIGTQSRIERAAVIDLVQGLLKGGFNVNPASLLARGRVEVHVVSDGSGEPAVYVIDGHTIEFTTDHAGTAVWIIDDDGQIGGDVIPPGFDGQVH